MERENQFIRIKNVSKLMNTFARRLFVTLKYFQMITRSHYADNLFMLLIYLCKTTESIGLVKAIQKPLH